MHSKGAQVMTGARQMGVPMEPHAPLSGPCAVSGDQLIGHAVQVIADDLRLRTDSQDIVANTLDQRGLPARRHGAEGVPSVAGDETKPGRLNSKLLLDISVSLA